MLFDGTLVVSTFTRHVFIHESKVLKYIKEVQISLVRPRLFYDLLILLVKILHHRAMLVVSFVCDLLIANRNIMVLVVSLHLPVIVVTHMITRSYIIWLRPRCLHILLVAKFISNVELLWCLSHWLALEHWWP